jgi:protein-L-isoaspartate(D-aspartate) O-methyltransferase
VLKYKILRFAQDDKKTFRRGLNLVSLIMVIISRFLALMALLLLAGGWGLAAAQEADTYQLLRERMVARQLKARGIDDARVLAAMGKVPRHLFVPEHLASLAYGDHPLPIGSGQTISQPYIVALMSEWAQIQAGDKVLEVGTGSGYQAAVLAELTDKVFSIDIRPELAEKAANLLKSLTYHQVKVKSGDGYQGWPAEAPFDAILVTAAAARVPPALEKQLKEGGRLVIPLGPAGRVQTLFRFRKVQGKLQEETRLSVIFVPLVEPEGKQ